MNLTSCPICGQELNTDERIIRWLHDLEIHRGYWKAQTKNMTKEQLESVLFEISDYFTRRAVKNLI